MPLTGRLCCGMVANSLSAMTGVKESSFLAIWRTSSVRNLKSFRKTPLCSTRGESSWTAHEELKDQQRLKLLHSGGSVENGIAMGSFFLIVDGVVRLTCPPENSPLEM